MTDVTASDLRSLYTGAAALVSRYGWWNCGLGDVNSGFCIIGAIDEYYNRYDPPYGTRNIAVAWLEDLVNQAPLHRWNDAKGNKVRVIDYLLRAAETAELGLDRHKGYDWSQG